MDKEKLQVTYVMGLCKWMSEQEVKGIVKYKYCLELQSFGSCGDDCPNPERDSTKNNKKKGKIRNIQDECIFAYLAYQEIVIIFFFGFS